MRYIPMDLLMLHSLERQGTVEDVRLPKPWHFYSEWKNKPLNNIVDDEKVFKMECRQLLYYDNGMWRMFNVCLLDDSIQCNSQLMKRNDQDFSDILSAKEITRAEFDELGFSITTDDSLCEVFETSEILIDWLKNRQVICEMTEDDCDSYLNAWKWVLDRIIQVPKDEGEMDMNRELLYSIGSFIEKYVGQQKKTGPFHCLTEKAIATDFTDKYIAQGMLIPNLAFVESTDSALPNDTWTGKGDNWLTKMCFVDNYHMFLNYDIMNHKMYVSTLTDNTWSYFYAGEEVKPGLIAKLLNRGYIKESFSYDDASMFERTGSTKRHRLCFC